MKKYNCECGAIIGFNQIHRHKHGKKHLDKMKKIELQYLPTDENEIESKWLEIVERRSFYLKQQEDDDERELRIIQLTNISDKYLEWLID
tara:strand:- start:176 stop:445 length:270 start_codon:yes stop_codon:yes gene_type:complete